MVSKRGSKRTVCTWVQPLRKPNQICNTLNCNVFSFSFFHAWPHFGIARWDWRGYGYGMSTFLITLTVFGVAVFGMALGLILSGGRKQLKGSCGGPSINPSCCLTCPEKEACDEEQMRQAKPDAPVQIRSTGNRESGHPVASPNQIN